MQGCPSQRSPPDLEYRAELLQLPYAFVPRPVVTAVDNRYPRYGGRVTLTYRQGGRAVTGASIVPPGANTHSLNMMQRVVFLKVVASRAGSVTVEMPAAGARVATNRAHPPKPAPTSRTWTGDEEAAERERERREGVREGGRKVRGAGGKRAKDKLGRKR